MAALDNLRQAFQQMAATAVASNTSSTNPGVLSLSARDITYHPPGATNPLLESVSFHVPAGGLGLIYGRSGSGKSTLLQVLAGLVSESGGLVSIDGVPCSAVARSAQIGMVFQFPERHFIGGTLSEEFTLAWPRNLDLLTRTALALQLEEAIDAVGIDLNRFPLTTDPRTLSEGYKRRLAIAVQLAQRPPVLLLDEPLAGLDWQVRAELTKLLASLKGRCTILCVSHDLPELAPMVDVAWEMMPGGELVTRQPKDLSSVGK